MDDKELEEEFNQLFAEEYNGKTVTSSLKVAAAFNKKHNNVLRDIDNLLKKIAETSDAPDTFFIKRTYNTENNNRSYPMYLMTLDGFGLLVSGYTGDDVFEKKLKYANMLIEKKVEKEKSKKEEKKPMGNLVIEMNNGHPVLDSREVAEMVGKTHAHLCRDIAGYIKIMSKNPKLDSSNFFIERTYKQAGNGKEVKCYNITKLGCEMIANKLTGKKGILFTAEYVKRFNEMEQQQQQQKQLTTADLFLQNALLMKEHELQLAKLTEETQLLKDTQKKQQSTIDTLNGVCTDETKRQKLNRLVRSYANTHGVQYADAWNLFKEMYNNAYHTNLKLQITNYVKANNLRKKPSKPEFLEETNQLDDALRIAEKM